MSMTKRNFIALADVIRKEIIGRIQASSNLEPRRNAQGFQTEREPMVNADVAIDTVIDCLADFCQSQNSQFNRQRWLGYIVGENGPNGGAR